MIAWAAIALLLAQTLALFSPVRVAAPGYSAALAELAALPGVAKSQLVLCVNDPATPGAPAHDHHDGDCPLCLTFGHALAAPVAIAFVAPSRRAAQAVRAPVRYAAPRAPPNVASRPRGPPAFV
ncbi:MAG: hypothetical protein KGL46_08120 [Hyphomicrobiales bacterium]|nr:hypothetical protein [Hyphomicrobiales bacterium]